MRVIQKQKVQFMQKHFGSSPVCKMEVEFKTAMEGLGKSLN